jgi:hypothetical protein
MDFICWAPVMTKRKRKIVPSAEDRLARLKDLAAQRDAEFKNSRLWQDADAYMKIVAESNTPLQRFTQFVGTLDAAQINKLARETLISFLNQGNPYSYWKEDNFDLNDPFVFSVYANFYLTLDPISGWHLPIFDAFRMARLDWQNPAHWFMLMGVLSWSVFPPAKSSGNVTYWTDDRLCELLRVVHRLNSGRRRELSELQVSKKLEESKLFGDKTFEAIRSALRQAKNPDENQTLNALLNRGMLSLKEDYAQRAISWPPNHIERALARFYNLKESEPQAERLTRPIDIFDRNDGHRDALFRELQESRRQNHRIILGLLSDRSIDTETFKTLLDARLENKAEVQAKIAYIEDEDGFLKLLDDMIKKDHEAILTAFLSEEGSKDVFAIVRHHQDWLANQEIMERLTKHFIALISAGVV